MTVLPSLYRAKAVKLMGRQLQAFVPQVFGDTPILIDSFLGEIPDTAGMGWVFFQGGDPCFPVWASGVSSVPTDGGGDGGGSGGGGGYAFHYNFNNGTIDHPAGPPPGELRLAHSGTHSAATIVGFSRIDADGKDVSDRLQMIQGGCILYIYSAADPDNVWQGYKTQYVVYSMGAYDQVEVKGGVYGGGVNFPAGPVIMEVLPGDGHNEVSVSANQPSDTYNPYVELWYDTDEPDAAPFDQSIKEQYFHFPASLALGTAAFTGLALTPVQGDTLMDVISLPRPSGWAGPDPLNGFAFRETGLYEIQGNLSLSTTVAGEQGLTYMSGTTRTGGVTTNLRGIGASYGPLLYNTYALFKRTIWVTSTDTMLRFAVLVQPAGISTWSSPGSLSIIKVRP